MSVRECLEFAAKLKLSGTLESKIERVNNIIEELRLTKC
jgi:ABC-type multidrug transport system ATPase subunit